MKSTKRLTVLFFLAAVLPLIAVSGAETQETDTEIASLQLQAQHGNSDAQVRLAAMYYFGEGGVAQNLEKAFQWYTKAADKGIPSAQFNLGLMYDGGEGTARNGEKAAAWFKRAAEQGHPKAQNNLAMLYKDGADIPRDFEKAFFWFSRAAAQGYINAQHNLALMYAAGIGVVRDYPTAYAWFSVASEQGSEESANNRDVILKLMEENRKEEARNLARELSERLRKGAP